MQKPLYICSDMKKYIFAQCLQVRKFGIFFSVIALMLKEVLFHNLAA